MVVPFFELLLEFGVSLPNYPSVKPVPLLLRRTQTRSWRFAESNKKARDARDYRATGLQFGVKAVPG